MEVYVYTAYKHTKDITSIYESQHCISQLCGKNLRTVCFRGKLTDSITHSLPIQTQINWSLSLKNQERATSTSHTTEIRNGTAKYYLDIENQDSVSEFLHSQHPTTFRILQDMC